MSHLIYVQFGSDVRLCSVADELKSRGIENSAKMCDGGLIFYVPHKSFRGIYLTCEKDGKYDGYFKLNVGANRTDLVLFANLLDAFIITHDARLFDQDEEYREIVNPLEVFSEEWINTTLGRDFSLVKTLSDQHSLQLFGINRLVSIGPWFLEQASVSEDKSDVDNADLAFDKMASLQWLPGHDVSTESRLKIEMDGQYEAVSAYMYSNETQGADYDYTWHAKIFCIYDIDKEEVVWFEYKYLPNVVPSAWERMDQTQYHIKPITREEFDQMVERAKEFQMKYSSENKVIREVDESCLDSPLVNHLYDKEAGNHQNVEVVIKHSEKDKEPDTPKQETMGKGFTALIILCVIAGIYIATKGLIASLIALLFCIIVIVGIIIFARVKNK